jgi:hypothetical protein
VRTTSGFAKIVAQGDESDLSAGTKLQGLAPGKYLVSVTADGYKIDGAHFTVVDGRESAVAVEMQPLPLPLATIKIQVFDDSVPADGTYEADAERGLAGFTGNLTDVFGPVTVDYYGNALCTVYLHDAAGRVRFDTAGKPLVDTTRSTGKCTSDAAGVITIPNLGPNRYGATVVPPAGSEWYQTNTLEGGHDWDIWTQEGDTGYDTEMRYFPGARPSRTFVEERSLSSPWATIFECPDVGRTDGQGQVSAYGSVGSPGVVDDGLVLPPGARDGRHWSRRGLASVPGLPVLSSLIIHL